MRLQDLHNVVEVGRIARPMRVAKPSPVERMGQIVRLRPLLQGDLHLDRHEFAGILLHEDEAKMEACDMAEFLTGQSGGTIF